jgi:hypothetical protein
MQFDTSRCSNSAVTKETWVFDRSCQASQHRLAVHTKGGVQGKEVQEVITEEAPRRGAILMISGHRHNAKGGQI